MFPTSHQGSGTGCRAGSAQTLCSLKNNFPATCSLINNELVHTLNLSRKDRLKPESATS